MLDRAELASLMPIWSHETDADLLPIIEATLRTMRRRGLAGHWAYDHALHANLYALYQRMKQHRP